MTALVTTAWAPGPPRRRRFGGLVTAMSMVGLLFASAAVWQTSQAAFTGSTQNATNAWTAGTVSLTDDDAGTAMFSVTGLVPGATATRCIAVTYGGSATAAVRLFVPTASGPLQSYLDLVVQEGSGGSFASCTGFTASSTLYTGTLASAASLHGAYGSGWSTWAPTGAAQSRTYRFTYTLNAGTPDSQQGNSANATLQWEARTP
jgi:hypothetical protein